MAEKRKDKRGGPRAGAGRPNLYSEGLRQAHYFLTSDQHLQLQDKAKAQGVSASAVLREILEEAGVR